MAGQGLCCGSLEQPKVLMKMGLSVILIGHVNFMLAALVQGVVLRHIDFQKHHRALEYAISAVVVLTAGLVGIIVGILTIVLAKNKKSRCLTWFVFVLCLVAAVLAGVSAVGLFVAVVMVIKHGGRILLSHCRFPDAIGYSSVTNECPFDPTRIYSTTLILWLPLIVTSLVQLVFCSRCVAVCISFLGLPCCCSQKKRPRSFARSVNVVKPLAAEPSFSPTQTSTLPLTSQPQPQPCHPAPLPPPRQTSRTSSRHSANSVPPLVKYTESPTRPSHTRSHSTQPARTHPSSAPRLHREESKQPPSPPPPPHVRRQHRNSAPPPGRQPQPKPRRERPQHEAAERARQRLLEEYQLLNRPDQPLQRGTMDRSSFWI